MTPAGPNVTAGDVACDCRADTSVECFIVNCPAVDEPECAPGRRLSGSVTARAGGDARPQIG